MRIISTTDSDFSLQLERLTGRFAGQDAQPAAAQRKTIEVFGKPLAPAEVVRTIVDAVRERGDDAVLEYAAKLDGYTGTAAELRVLLLDRHRRAVGLAD